jgi:imidazolonepropionase-like amidohydrolase
MSSGAEIMIAITNGEVWTITNGVIKNGTVLIENGKIIAVGKDLAFPEDAEVFDVAGKVVMPGLIDAHTHVGIFNDGVGGGHSDGNEMTDPITPHLRALDAVHPEDMAFQDLIEAGITTVLTGPGSANLVGGQWICVKTLPTPNINEMILKEPAGMKLALGENPRRVYGSQKRIPSTRMGSAALLRSALVDAQNYLNKWGQYEAELAEFEGKEANDRGKKPNPPERNLKLEALGKLLTRELKARIHAHRADDILTAIRIAEEFNLDLTIEHATEGYKIADILAEKNIPVTVGPIFTSRYKYELRDRTPTNPGILAKAGVKVAIQTDQMSAVKYLTINAALAVREGMPEEDAIKAITINAAEIIGVDDRIGSLEVGKDADISIFSGHPFDYKTLAELVFVDGKLVYQRDTN